jgi:hypothetical protein
MTDTRDRNLKYGDNRYGFHLSTAEQKAGVSPEFAHAKVFEPIKSLGFKTDKALSLRPDDKDYLLAVELLEKCGTRVQNSLDNKISQQPEAENIESSNISYNRGF